MNQLKLSTVTIQSRPQTALHGLLRKPINNLLNTIFVHSFFLGFTLISLSNLAQAACSNVGDIYTCTGDSSNEDAYLTGTFILNNSGAPASFSNISNSPVVETIPAVVDADGVEQFSAEFGAILRNFSASVEAARVIIASGGNPVTISNTGGLIQLRTIDMNGAPTRMFDPGAWAYNELTKTLFNGGAEVGYAAAIFSDQNTPSLTINNNRVNNGLPFPGTGQLGISSTIAGSGEFTAAIYSNSALLTVNNTGDIGKIASYGGASYTPPTLQDGTQSATGVTAGLTVINNTNSLPGTDFSGNISSIYVVDRKILLTEAQTASGLAVAFGQNDIGPRNSIINNTGGSTIGGDIYLGSGAHVINNIGSAIRGTIYVDQTDAVVSEVVGGVNVPLYSVHGDRTFSLNYDAQQAISSNNAQGDVIINDVFGAVNTINYQGKLETLFTNFTANGLGNNTLNLACTSTSTAVIDFVRFAGCNYNGGGVSGFTTFNLAGTLIDLGAPISVNGDINLNASEVRILGPMTASNVIIGSQTTAGAVVVPFGNRDRIGSITGNLINNGTLNIGSAIFNVDGNVQMNAGSNYLVSVGQLQSGAIVSTGTTTFDANSTIKPRVNSDRLVRNDDIFIFANNIIGLPTVQNGTGFLQFTASEVNNNLVLTAMNRVPDFLKGTISRSASNAVDAFFSYKGDNVLALALQGELQQQQGINVVRAAERLRPETNDGALRMVLSNTDKVFGILDSRLLDSYLASVKGEYDAEKEASLTTGAGLWVQGFGDRGAQDGMQGSDGFGSSSAGMAAGIDRAIDDAGNKRVGFSAGFARGNVTNTGNTVNNRVDINSFMGAAYGSWAMDDWYINGALGVARNTYQGQRNLSTYGADSRHDSWQFSSRVEAGFPILLSESLAFIPIASLDYSHIKESGYKEDGRVVGFVTEPSVSDPTKQVPIIVDSQYVERRDISPLNLQIEGRTFDSIRGGLGGKAIYSLQQTNWGAELELHGMYRHEFGDLTQDNSARFVVGSNSFKSSGIKPARDGFIVGGRLRLTGDDETDQLTLSANYDADIREKYFGQIMSLNLRYDFDGASDYFKKAKAKILANRAKLAKIPPTQLAKVTEKDIASINQAMQMTDVGSEFTLPVFDAAKQKEVDATIKTWATALTNKNTDMYFKTYSANFVTPDGSTRQQWERKRKTEISKEANTAIKISDLTIAPEGDHALAMFTQTVTSGSQQEAVQKIVEMECRSGQWLIVSEYSVSLVE